MKLYSEGSIPILSSRYCVSISVITVPGSSARPLAEQRSILRSIRTAIRLCLLHHCPPTLLTSSSMQMWQKIKLLNVVQKDFR